MARRTRAASRLEALMRASQAVVSSLDFERVLQAIVEQAAAISGAACVRLFLLDQEAGLLRSRVGSGLPREVERDFVIPMGAGHTGEVAATRRPLAVADTRQDPRNLFPAHVARYGLVSYLGLPVICRERLLGVLALNTPEPRTYSTEEIAFLSAFADQAAIAIENARLHAAVREQAAGLEGRVQARTEELEAALRHKAEFLGRMSHELRTPLNHILGFAEILRQGMAGPLSPQQGRHIDRIHTGGMQLLALVDDLLNLSRVETGARSLALEVIPLAPLVVEACDFYAEEAKRKGLRLAQEVPFDLEAVAERGGLAQILLRLLSNAVKFTPAGGVVTVTARRIAGCGMGSAEPEAGEPAGDKKGIADWGGTSAESAAATPAPDSALRTPRSALEIVVSDTGIGIAAEDLTRIFQGLEQGDSSLGRRHGGAGIGLALARRLATRHGGTLTAESAGAGRGSRFILRLPDRTLPPPRRVLIMVEDPAVFRSVALFLRDAGYAVDGAGRAAEGLVKLARESPDLLLLDADLPDLEGWQVLRQVRWEARTQALPVLVLVTAGSDQEERVLALEADAVLTKPVVAEALTECVRTLLEGKSAAP